MSDEKLRIRLEMLARRAAEDRDARVEMSQRIAKAALELGSVKSARAVCSFVGKDDEVDTAGLMWALVKSKPIVAAPRVERSGVLALHRITAFPRGFQRGGFGILEPDPQIYKEAIRVSDLDVIFVPGIAFDRRGWRIGYGKGYYDRLLAEAKGVYKVGLAFGFQLVDEIHPEPHDVQLDDIITEEGRIERQ